MTYRIATNPDGQQLWWCDHETIPGNHTDVRPATPAESALANRIMAHDRAGRMPPISLGKKMTALLTSQATLPVPPPVAATSEVG